MRKGWELKKIGECFSYIKNGANIKQTKGARGYPITRIETLSGGVFNRDKLGYADVVNLEQYKDYILESGDLLVSHINSKTYIGRTVVYEGMQGEKIIHGMNLLRLKHNMSLISSAFFCYYTQSVSFKLDIMRIRKDAVNQSSFTISDFKKIRIPVPVLATQLSIVSELDKINELIRIKKEQLKDYETLAQSIFYEMFGDPVENEKGWEVKKLGEVSIYPKERVAINQICSSQYVGVENLIKDRGGVRFSDNLPKADVAIAYKENDILLGNIRPYLKKIWLADKVGGASGDVVIIRIKERSISPLFLFKLLSSDQFFEYDNTHTKGAKMPRGDRKAIEKFGVILPPLPLQYSFAQKIEQIEQQKAAIQKTITDLETLLAARMQYWFD